jgi:UDP-N-acetylmuramoylalanine--D-glutamate ligase
MQEEDVRGRRFSILGGARSGVAAAELLVSHGAKVFLSDRNSEQAMTSVAAELRSMGTEFEFGDNTDRVLDADMLVVSPGVRSDAPLLQKAIRRGIPIISELELASRFCSAPIVAITGTNGKTTTTTLAGRMFADARVPCAVAGSAQPDRRHSRGAGGEQFSTRPHRDVSTGGGGDPEHHAGSSRPLRTRFWEVHRVKEADL